MSPRRRRARWWLLLALIAGALVAGGWAARRPLGRAAAWVTAGGKAAVEAVEGWAGHLQFLAEALPADEGEPPVRPAASRSALIVLGSGPGDAAFALVAASPEGPASLTLVPQSLRGVIPGYGEFPLAETMAFEGPDLAALTVANELGVRIDTVLALAPGDLAAALPGPVAVDLPVPLFVLEGDGPAQAMAAGAQRISPAEVELLLVTAGAGDPFEWLQRQGAVWRGVLEVLAVDPGVAEALAAHASAGVPETARLLQAVATADDPLLGALPVEAAAGGSGEALVLSAGAANEFVPARLGHLLLMPGVRPRAEVLNGNGRLGATRVVAEALVRRGFRVVRTDNADRFDYAQTVVVAQGAGAQEAAGRAAGILGVGAVYLEEAAPSPAVEVSIIVGLDIPAGEA